MIELQEILNSKKYDTDKGAEYLSHYERFFSSLRDKPVSLLELGIHKGGSLLLWRDYFRNGTVLGIDIHPAPVQDESGRIHVYKGRQQDTVLLDRIMHEHAPDGLDIVIDDASHFGEATKISFWHLYVNHLKPGGIYVIEDWRTGYWGQWFDGKRLDLSKQSGDDRNVIQKMLDKKLDQIFRSEDSDSSRSFKKRLLVRARNFVSPKHFHSHEAGMVGFVKELIDELAIDAVTRSWRGYVGEPRNNRIANITFTAGQVFIIKPGE